MTTRGSIAAAAVLAAMVAGMPAAAMAKKKRNSLTATVNGKRIIFNRNVRLTAGGSTVAFSVLGQRFGRVLRTLGAACGDFPPAAVPGASMHCTFNYQETKIGRHPVFKAWELPTADGQVTFSSYDGSQVAGSFSAVLQSPMGDPPVTVQGAFRGQLVFGE